jgi:hypothetical protein
MLVWWCGPRTLHAIILTVINMKWFLTSVAKWLLNVVNRMRERERKSLLLHKLRVPF